MRSNVLSLLAVSAVLSACSVPILDQTPAVKEKPTLPESVTALADPNQDLETTRIDDETGCALYLHKGPVETLWLPVRSRAGGPICITYVDKDGNPVEPETS